MRPIRILIDPLLARPILLSSMVTGVVVGFLLPQTLAPLTRAIIAWDCGVLWHLLASTVRFSTSSPARMAVRAAAEEEGEWTIFGLTVAGIAFSFAAIVGEFSAVGQHQKGGAFHLALVVVTLLASWLMTHVTFTYRYAHEYYTRSPGGREVDRGLEFPGEPNPDYWDFLYFSLVLGMTFQVSDVQVTARKLRRLATIHGFLAFVFNTVIVALCVNLAAGLL